MAFNLFNNAIVSPPPATEYNELVLLFLIIDLAISILPFAKSGFSQYPAGPFHKTVLLLFIKSFISSIV